MVYGTQGQTSNQTKPLQMSEPLTTDLSPYWPTHTNLPDTGTHSHTHVHHCITLHFHAHCTAAQAYKIIFMNTKNILTYSKMPLLTWYQYAIQYCSHEALGRYSMPYVLKELGKVCQSYRVKPALLWHFDVLC